MEQCNGAGKSFGQLLCEIKQTKNTLDVIGDHDMQHILTVHGLSTSFAMFPGRENLQVQIKRLSARNLGRFFRDIWAHASAHRIAGTSFPFYYRRLFGSIVASTRRERMRNTHAAVHIIETMFGPTPSSGSFFADMDYRNLIDRVARLG